MTNTLETGLSLMIGAKGAASGKLEAEGEERVRVMREVRGEGKKKAAAPVNPRRRAPRNRCGL
jgi:hypothetical protein